MNAVSFWGLCGCATCAIGSFVLACVALRQISLLQKQSAALLMKQMELEEALKKKADRAGRKKKSEHEAYHDSLKKQNVGLSNVEVPGLTIPRSLMPMDYHKGVWGNNVPADPLPK